MPLDRHLTPDSNKNTQVPRTVNTHTELTGGPAYPDCRPPPGRSVTDSQTDLPGDELRTGEIASKFKLFNTIYEIVSRQGNNYTIRDVATGREVPANVSQIARMRSDPVEPEEDQVQLDSKQVWRKLQVVNCLTTVVNACDIPNQEQ